MPKVKGAHHRGTYHVASAKVRAAANANPHTRCWRCGLTLAQARAKWGQHVHWQAGHVRTSDPTSPLLPECSHDNASHGAAWGNRRRRTNKTRRGQQTPTQASVEPNTALTLRLKVPDLTTKTPVSFPSLSESSRVR